MIANNMSSASLAVLLASASAAPALAQTPVPPATPESGAEAAASAADASAPTAATSGVGDIIVTAQRRSENLQRVPISISAFNADTLQKRNVTSTTDLMAVTPGLQIGSGTIQRNEVSIRGIGSNRFDAGGEASSGLFLDDVYQPRFSSLFMDLLDIERVEVLKGPQGTLYGRNTIGGAIAVYTPTPDQNVHVSARGDVGNKDLISGQISIRGPLSDTIAIGVSGGVRSRDGFMRDTVSGKDNGVTSYGGRVKLAFTPSPQLKIVLTGGAFKTRQDALVFDRPVADIFFSRPGLLIAPDSSRYTNAYNSPTGASSRNYQGIGRIDYTGSDVVLTSITSYQNTRDLTSDDQDSSTADAFGYTQTGVSKSYGQEFRLSSVNTGSMSFGGRLKWLLGLYYFHENGVERTNFRFGRDSISVFLATINGFPPPNGEGFNLIGKNIKVNSYAAFGQATLAVTDALNLTLGARYTRDRKRFFIFGNTTLPGLPLVPANYSVDVGKSWGRFTPKVAIDYTITPGVLFYASYAKGYKSGAPQSAVFNPILASRIVDPESVDTVEVGAKTEFLDRKVRLNVAGYRSKFKDLQVRLIVPVGTPPVAQPVLANAATSTIKGIEADLTLAPVRGLNFDIGYNYLDARYDNFVPSTGTVYSGNRLPRAPKHTLTASARYNVDLPNGGGVGIGAQVFTSSRIYFQPDNVRSQSQPHYTTADGNISYTFPNHRLTATAWVKNAFNREYLVYFEPLAPSARQIFGDKRTFGLTLSYRQ